MSDPTSDEKIQKQIEQFADWMNNQPHLPNHLDKKFLLRFLHGCGYDLEKTKTAFELFISIRESSPELLSDRDPLSPQVQHMFTFLKQSQLKISGNQKLWIWKLDDPGLKKFDALLDAKMFFITTDMWLLFDDFLEEGDIVLMDTRDIISLKFLYSKFSLSLARKMLRYQQEAIPIRLKGIHVVNAPPFINRIFTFLKPFLRKDITEMMHFHTSGSETLHDYFSKDDLPEDYGGTRQSIDDYMKDFVEHIASKREYFLENNLWRVQNGKPVKKAEDPEIIMPLQALEID